MARLLESYGGVLNEIKRPKMVTVSMRSRPKGELKQAVKELWDAFSRLRHRDVWRTVRGAIVSLEITWNSGDGTWHPHLHILIDSEFIVWQQLRDAWVACTLGEGSAVYIQKCRPGWQRELLKYVTKVKDLFDDFEVLTEFLAFAKGRRFVRTYGQLYNCAVSKEECVGPIHCRGCGAAMVLERRRVRIEELYNPLGGLGCVAEIHENSPPCNGFTERSRLVVAGVI